MNVLNVIRRNPAAALAVVAAGILGWIGAGLVNTTTPEPVARTPLPPRLMPQPEMFPDAVAVDLTNPGQSEDAHKLSLLPKIRPGMTRAEVEGILGKPADDIEPVTLTGGQPRYRAAYDLGEPEPPATVRPIRNFRLPPILRPEPARVALEFDASKPGHPLIEVLYLDPLF